MNRPVLLRRAATSSLAVGVVLVLGVATLLLPASPAPADESAGLAPVSSFAGIQDEDARAAALFAEAGKVLLHPRCVNCHPAGDEPLQGDEGRIHEPPVRRGGNAGVGVAGMRCETCHFDANFDPGRVPGAPHWHLAPRSMAWEGLTLGELCAQLKDGERNGGMSLKEVVAHMRDDALVGWAWEPGPGREPAPGSQEALGELIAGWVEAGAACP